MPEILSRPISSLPPGTAFSRFLTLLVRSGGLVTQALEQLEEPLDWSSPDLTIDRAWRATPQVRHAMQLRLKAATAPGTTTDSTWAAPLAEAGIAAEAIAFMRGVSILGALAPRCRRVPFNLKIPRALTDAALGDWIGEGQPTPAVALSFDAIGPLPSTKVGAITSWTREFAVSTDPAAQETMRQGVLGGLATLLDHRLLDPSIDATAARPASITWNVPPIISSGATAAAISADLQAMLASITTSGGGLTWIMGPKTAGVIAGALGAASELPRSLLSLPVIVHANSPNQVTLVDAANLLLADDGLFDVDVSNEALVQLNTTPDAPATPTTVLTSFWQGNVIGLRARRWIHWLVARPGAVAYMIPPTPGAAAGSVPAVTEKDHTHAA